MRRMGFRHWLMIGQTLLYVLLVWGVPFAVQHWARKASPTIQQVALQEGAEMNWDPVDPGLPLREQLRMFAVSINAPATIAGGVLLLATKQVFAIDPEIGFAFILPFVPLLWYAIACWLERRKGLLAELPPRRGRVWNVVRYTALTGSVVLFGLGVFGVITVHCHYISEMMTVCVMFLGWPALSILFSVNAVRRARAQVNNS